MIDDCSTDETAEVVREFSRKDQRIQLLQLTKNSGAAAARNEGISAASGRFIAFWTVMIYGIGESLKASRFYA